MPEGTTFTRRRAEILREIKEAGLELFSKNGFEETTINDIVAKTRVSRRTFFRYFASKDDIVFSWVDDEGEQAWRLLTDRTADEDQFCAAGRAFVKYAGRRVRDLENSRRVIKLIFDTPSLRGRFHDRVALWEEKLNDALQASFRYDPDALFRLRVQNAAAVAVYMTAVEIWIKERSEEPLNRLVSAAFEALKKSEGR